MSFTYTVRMLKRQKRKKTTYISSQNYCFSPNYLSCTSVPLALSNCSEEFLSRFSPVPWKRNSPGKNNKSHCHHWFTSYCLFQLPGVFLCTVFCIAYLTTLGVISYMTDTSCTLVSMTKLPFIFPTQPPTLIHKLSVLSDLPTNKLHHLPI